MTDLDQIQTISTEELSSIQNRVNKEIERRSGADIDIKKIRTQLYKLAKALGCEWIADNYPQDLGEETDRPNKRGRKRKTEEAAPAINKVEQPAAPLKSARDEEEKRKGIWSL